MSMLQRKQTIPASAPDEVTGDSILRQHLRHYMVRPGLSLAKVAEHLNEDYGITTGRNTARHIAARMAGPDANDAVARGIAKLLAPSLGGDAMSAGIVSGSELESFANDKGDLSTEVKSLLAAYFFGGHAAYDPDSGLLKGTYDAPQLSAGRPPSQWQHPDARVRETHAAYLEALKAYNDEKSPPPPPRPAPVKPRQLQPGWLNRYLP